MSSHDAREQYFLELVNRARMNPVGEAKKYGISLNQGLNAGSIGTSPKQVLAGNSQLNNSATAHSSYMLGVDEFEHSGIGDRDPFARMKSNSYSFNGAWTWGENISWKGSTGSFSLDGAVASEHQGLFLSPGHRVNILNDGFREIGIGSVGGKFTYKGTTYNSLMSTQNFATSGIDVFVTGVAYKDSHNDNFYSIGEGQGGISVDLYDGATLLRSSTTAGAGGYALKTTASGSLENVFSGGTAAGEIGARFTLGKENVKIDLVDGNTIETNVSITLTRDAKHARIIGIESKSVTGNALSNRIDGNVANNTLSGAAGNDSLVGHKGADKLTGGEGADKFYFYSPSDGGDHIMDFAEEDCLVFSSSAFGKLARGALSSSAFHRSSTGLAHDATDRFIYNTTTDTLYFDSNGTGSGGVVKVAMFDNGYLLSAADILIA